MLHSFFLKRKVLLVFCLLLIIALCIAVISAVKLLSRTTFYNGIYIEDTCISGYNIIQARKAIENMVQEKYSKQKIILDSGLNSTVLSLNDLSVEFLTEQALKKAYQIGRNGSPFKRLREIIMLDSQSINIELQCQYSRAKAESILNKIKSQVDKKERSASVNVNRNHVDFEKEIIGKELDLQKNILAIENCIFKKRFGPISLYVSDIVPEIQYDEIKDMNHVLSTFSTSFNSSNYKRSYNIKLACENINSSIIMPGKVFSMDEALGPRKLENGYREAPVILNNELIEGVGGGVCQVTTTLYVAVLKARLAVIERCPHSLTLAYVEPGQDATIAENSIDFKFKNDTSYPICLGAEVQGNRISISFIGRKSENDYSIKLKSEVVKTYIPEKTEYIIDNSVAHDEQVVIEKPRNGCRVIVYREIYDNSGNLIKREKISEDSYKSVQGRIKVNESYFEPEIIETQSSYEYPFFY